MAVKILLACAVLLVLAWGLTLWQAARAETRAEAAFPPSGAFVTVDGTRVHYLQKGNGPDLVLIHGLSGNLRDVSFSLLDRLAQDYRVLAFDRPGLGYTDSFAPKGETLAQQARLLQAAAARLGAPRPLVLGQSYGGAVALAWAVEHPDNLSGLILVSSPALPWEGEVPLLYKVTSHPVLGPLVRPILTAWVPDSYVTNAIRSVFAPQQMPQGYDRHIGAPLTLRRATLRANAQHRAGLLGQITAMAPRYDTIATPIELIHGTADATVSLEIHSRALAARLDTARLSVLEGIGHMPHHSREGAVVEAIHRAAIRAGLR